VQRETQAQRVQLAQQDRQVNKAIKDHRETEVPKETRAKRDQQETKVYRENKEILVQPVKRVPQDIRVLQALWVQWEFKENKA
jgi:hypothetical protein